MATAAATSSPSDTECAICHEFFTEPKLLPCAHLLCRSCLVRWMESEKDALCPLCRAEIVDPKEKNDNQVEDIVDSFPTDHSMVVLVNATKLLAQSHVCKVCVDVAASSLCLDCGDMLCTKCCAVHEKLSATSHHTVERLMTLSEERLAAKLPVTCTVHANRSAELYCSSHDKSICFLCVGKEHRNCSDVQTLQEKQEETQPIIAGLVATLSAQEAKLKGEVRELDKYFEGQVAKADQLVQEVELLCDDIVAATKACCQQTKDMILREYCTWNNSEVQRKNASAMQHVMSHKRVLERTHDSPPRDDINNMITSMERRVNDVRLASSSLRNITAGIPEKRITVNKQAANDIKAQLKNLVEVRKPKNKKSANKQSVEVTHHCFHMNHGKNVLLSNCLQTAVRMRGEGDGIVVFQNPMNYDTLYEVQIDQIDSNFGCHTVYFGLLTEKPETVILPDWSCNLASTHTVVIGSNAVIRNRKEIKWQEGSKLLELKVGSRVGLALDTTHHLHLFIDSKKVATVIDKIKTPCHAMIDLLAHWKQVTICPASKVTL